MSTHKTRTIGIRIREWRESKKLNQPDAATQLGIPFSTYQKYEMDNRSPGSDALGAFARAGLNINWLLTGEGVMMLPNIPADWGSWVGTNQVRDPHIPYGSDHLVDGFVLVPRYDVSASMGNGSVIHSEQIVDHLAFRESWVRTELGTNPSNLILISAIGDSMEPTLRAGDLLLIDRSNRSVKQDAIYAFATNGELRVKRMQLKIDGRVVVKSDNSQYESETLDSSQIEHLNIIGRVVWSGRRM